MSERLFETLQWKRAPITAAPTPLDTFEALRAAPLGLESLIAETGIPGFPDDPPPLEYARRLLAIAAQVEHEFLLQYLYAGYSLPSAHPWRAPLVVMAKEEMGHFLTVQNLLMSIGQTPHLELEPYPLPNAWYPFVPSREAFTASSLRRYLLAESPANAALPLGIGQGRPVHRVGVIYATLYWLFLPDGDVRRGPWADFPPGLFADIGHLPSEAVGDRGNQVTPAEWGSDAAGIILSAPARIIVETIGDTAAAVAAVYRIAGQGEGLNSNGSGAEPSHYQRLLEIYTASQGSNPPAFAEDIISNPVLTGPPDTPGLITDHVALTWARIAAVRYRILLLEIGQALLFQRTRTIGQDRVREVLFQDWIRSEMQNVKALSERLVTLPAKEGTATPKAGPPLQGLTEFLPVDEKANWKLHRALIAETGSILQTVTAGPADSLAQQLSTLDAARLAWMDQNKL